MLDKEQIKILKDLKALAKLKDSKSINFYNDDLIIQEKLGFSIVNDTDYSQIDESLLQITLGDIEKLLSISKSIKYNEKIKMEKMWAITATPLFIDTNKDIMFTYSGEGDIDEVQCLHNKKEQSVLRASHHDILSVIFHKNISPGNTFPYRLLLEAIGFKSCFPAYIDLDDKIYYFSIMEDLKDDMVHINDDLYDFLSLYI